MKRVLVLLILFLLFIECVFSVSQPIISVFSGKVKISGNNAQTGLLVKAYANGSEVGSTSTYTGYDGDTWYTLLVFNVTDGAIVTFKINNVTANEQGIYVTGKLIILNITFASLPTTTTTTVSQTTTTTISSGTSGQTTTTTALSQTTFMVSTTVSTSIPATTTIISYEGELGTTTSVEDTSGEERVSSSTTIQEESNNKGIIQIPSKQSSSESPRIISSAINFLTGNSFSIIAIFIAFLLGYFVSRKRRKEDKDKKR